MWKILIQNRNGQIVQVWNAFRNLGRRNLGWRSCPSPGHCFRNDLPGGKRAKKPDTERSANLPQGENVLRVSLFFFFFKHSLSLLPFFSWRDEEGGKCRIIDAVASTFMEMGGDSYSYRARKQCLSVEIRAWAIYRGDGNFIRLFLRPRLTNGNRGWWCEICGVKWRIFGCFVVF